MAKEAPSCRWMGWTRAEGPAGEARGAFMRVGRNLRSALLNLQRHRHCTVTDLALVSLASLIELARAFCNNP